MTDPQIDPRAELRAAIEQFPLNRASGVNLSFLPHEIEKRLLELQHRVHEGADITTILQQIHVDGIRIAAEARWLELERNDSGLSQEAVISRIPEGSAIASGFDPVVAVVLGLIPIEHRGVIFDLDRGIAPTTLAQLLRDAPGLDAGNIASSSALSWWLAARQLQRTEGVDAPQFLDQLNHFRSIVNDEEARMSLARSEFEAMHYSVTTIPQLGNQVGFGERQGAVEAAFMQGFRVAVFYNGIARQYEIHSMREPGQRAVVETCATFNDLTARVQEKLKRLPGLDTGQVRFSSRLWKMMEEAVRRTSPHRIKEFLSKESGQRYEADQRVLIKFLVAMGTFDPYEARRRASWTLPSVKELPAHVLQGEVGAVSASGQHLTTGNIFAALNRGRTVSQVMYCGEQAYLSLCREWPTDQEILSGTSARGRRADEQERIRSLALPTVQYSLVFPDTETKRQERPLETALQRRRREYTEVLAQTLEKIRTQLGEFASRGELVILANTNEGDVLVRQKGRTLLGRLRELAELPESEGGFPDEVRAKYIELTSTTLPKTDERIKELLTALMMEVAVRDLVRKDVALSAWKRDITYLLAHPDLATIHDPGHLLFQNMTEIRAALEGGSATLPQSEIGRVMNLFPIAKVRAALNRQHLEKRGGVAALRRASDLLRPLFLEPDGRWREDAIGQGLPMGRIRGRLEHRFLDRSELLMVKRFFYLLTGCYAPEHLFTNAAHEDFVAVVDATLKAGAKISYMRDILDGLRLKRSQVVIDGAKLDFSTITEELDEVLVEQQKRLPREKKGEERFRLISDFPKGTEALQVLLQRASARSGFGLEGWGTADGTTLILPLLRAGLYPVGAEAKLAKWCATVSTWKELSDLETRFPSIGLANELEFIRTSPLVLRAPTLAKRYFTPAEVQEIETALQALPELRELENRLLELRPQETRAQIAARRDKERGISERSSWDQDRFYQGFIHQDSHEVIIYVKSFLKIIEACDAPARGAQKSAFMTISRFEVINPELLHRAFELVDREFEIPRQDWLQRADEVKGILSLRRREQRYQFGTHVSYGVLDSLVHCSPQRDVRVRAKLVAMIDALHRELSQRT